MKNIYPNQILRLVFLVIISIFINQAFAQTGVRIAGTAGTADNSAMLDVVSNSKGVLIPRMLQSERTGISSPAIGLLVYQTDGSKGFYYFDGAIWVQLSAGALSGSGANNFLARWSGGGLTTGASYDDGTNVGIGNTGPGAKLDVSGTLKASGAATLSGGLLTQGTASTLYGTNASIYANNANAAGGGIMISDDGGFFDYNNGPVTFNGSTGLVIGGSSGASTAGGGYLRVNQLAGTGTRIANVDANGTFTAGASLAGTGTRTVLADANGALFTNARIVGTTTAASAAQSTGTVSNYVTANGMSVTSGDLIEIRGTVGLQFTGPGSGNDHWVITVRSTGCATSTVAFVETAIPSISGRSARVYQYPFLSYWTATCTGTVNFTIDIFREDADDAWVASGAAMVVTKQ